jgi:hypothetical protein
VCVREREGECSVRTLLSWGGGGDFVLRERDGGRNGERKGRKRGVRHKKRTQERERKGWMEKGGGGGG